jgi:hypothetical protein
VGVLVADVSRDNTPDALGLNAGSGSVTTFIADASGVAHFARSVESEVGFNPVAFTVFSLGDSPAPDLLVANGAVIGPTTATQGRLTILSGNGNGAFASVRVLSRSNGPDSVPVSDPVALAVGRFDTRSASDDIVWAERSNPVQALPGGLILVTAAANYQLPPPVVIPDGGTGDGGATDGGVDAAPPDLSGGPVLRVFAMPATGAVTALSSKTTNDTTCTATANGAGLTGNYVALMSYGAGMAPADFVNLAGRSVVVPGGQLVATAANFFSNTHVRAINQLATGASSGAHYVWTAMTPLGSNATPNCAGWTTTTGSVWVGNTFSFTGSWAMEDTFSCSDTMGYIYCLETP